MKTTVELPDTLYRELKARAAMRGQSVKLFLLEAIQQKLAQSHVNDGRQGGWRSIFGKAKASEVASLQRSLDEEFSRVDADDWE